MKKSLKRLCLNSETLRSLDLRGVVGGDQSAYCSITCALSCGQVGLCEWDTPIIRAEPTEFA